MTSHPKHRFIKMVAIYLVIVAALFSSVLSASPDQVAGRVLNLPPHPAHAGEGQPAAALTRFEPPLSRAGAFISNSTRLD